MLWHNHETLFLKKKKSLCSWLELFNFLVLIFFMHHEWYQMCLWPHLVLLHSKILLSSLLSESFINFFLFSEEKKSGKNFLCQLLVCSCKVMLAPLFWGNFEGTKILACDRIICGLLGPLFSSLFQMALDHRNPLHYVRSHTCLFMESFWHFNAISQCMRP